MEITNISSLDRASFINQDYAPKDEILLNALEVNNDFGNSEDKIEIHIISPDGEVLESSYDFRNYKITNTVNNTSLFNQIELDPKTDLESFGYFSGQYDVNYNFYRQLFLSNPANNYFISEISPDRTEIRITNNNISYTDLGQAYLNYIATRNSRNFYSDFILNFGDNKTYIGVNIAFDNVNENIPSLYIKLYEPLPAEIGIKDTLWIVESISEPYSFRVNTEFIAEDTNITIPLKGPNINIDLNDKVNLTTPYLNLSNLLNNSSTSSYQQLQSWLDEKSIEITVDYTDFSNFVHFSSATERLENFKYKLNQIQSLQADINALSSINPLAGPTYINSNKAILQSKLDTLIQKLDGYEYYLYYETGSKAWPKTTSVKPYINAGVNDPQAKTWFGSTNESSNYYGGEILSASNYDASNRDYIWNNLPDYIKADSQNANLELFTSMLGQHYDYIWTYIKDITDIQVADNRIDFGISKDLVADTLRSFGIKLYTNSRNQDDIYSSLLGINAEGSFLPSTGSYLIDTYVTASQYTIPDNDIVKETYKRIYHNMPYLLKTRGTRAGLRALINCFGIPETILKVREYGGLDKDSNDVTTFYEKFAYGFSTNGSSSLSIPWLPLNSQYLDTTHRDIVPDTLEFRFKTPGIPDVNHYSQSLFYVTSPTEGLQFGIQLLYPSGTNASYSTNELNEAYSKYGELRFFLSGSNGYKTTTPLYLPFFNGDWWNVKLNRETGSLRLNQTGSNNTYTLSSKNSIYNGYNGISVGFQGSTSLFITGSVSSSYNRAWSNYTTFDISQYGYDSPLALYDFDFTIYDDNTIAPPYFGYLGGDGVHNSPLAPNNIFSGSFQEFRYWIGNLENTSFSDHTLHPRSIVGNNPSASYSELSFRLPLGNELDNNLTPYLTSVHPTIAGNQITSSFLFESGSTSVVLSTAKINALASASYESTVYTSLINTPNIGATTEVDDKVRITDKNLIPGDVLTPYISIQKPGDIPYTNDLSIVDISLSPQDSINEDIIAQLGTFNIDEYIGDPRLASLTSYPALTELRNFYFQKYSKSQNIFDLIKLLSYFDNSLFKMIKDFVPAKANLSTGLTIKPHILERNKTERHEPTLTFVDHSGSIETAFISGSNGLNLDLNTDYTEIITNDLLPSFPFNHTDRRELFTGELGGSELEVYYPPSRSIVYESNKLNVSTSIAIANRFSELPFQPTLNNILNSRTTNNYLDIDYAYNPNIPVNIDYLSASLALSLRTNAYPFLDATVQDSNYTLKRHILPRYEGSRLFGENYNIFSLNDISYGSDPVINQNSVKFAYFNEITSQSRTLPGRTNVNIKYLIDSASNIIELTEANKNLFDVQDIFNRTNANIALDNVNQPSNQKTLNGLKPIYAGGFRYEPILQNVTPPNTTGQIIFDLSEPFSVINTSGAGAGVELSLGATAAIPQSPFQLATPITSTPLNEVRTSTPCQTILDSYINVVMKKNVATNQDIYIRVTGSVTFEQFISPSATEYPVLYQNLNFTGLQYSTTVPGTYKRAPYNGVAPAFWPEFSYGAVKSVKVPARTYIKLWSYDPTEETPIIYGPATIVACVNDYGTLCHTYLQYDELAAVSWGFTDTYVNTDNYNYLNEFSNDINIQFLEANAPADGAGNIVYTSVPLPPGTSNNNNEIEYNNQYGVRVVFKIDALIKIPGNINVNTNYTATLLNRNLQPARIRTIPTFYQYGGAISYTKAPSINFQNTLYQGDYFAFSSPPLFNYIGQFNDNGFNSGSGAVNWFFERGKEGDDYLNLTASYDLSDFYYKYIKSGNNSITQTLYYASSSSYSGVGYNDVQTLFSPKKGDLIRLYNHDSNLFPIDFEREILDIIEPQNQPLSSSYDSRLVFKFLQPIPNQSCLDYDTKIQNVIFLSKIPDETNVIIMSDKKVGETSPGILTTENISEDLKNEAGNIIKELKSQNLI
jgi:hypothetical protein